VPVSCLLLAITAAPAFATPGGDLSTLHNGRWTCEMPGTAVSQPKPAADEGFRIMPDSSYRTPDGTSGGGYLLLGRALTFTSGPTMAAGSRRRAPAPSCNSTATGAARACAACASARQWAVSPTRRKRS
jgi:hypothetical protein